MATRLQREHQWPVKTVFPEGDRPLGALAGETQRGFKATERTPEKNARL